MMDELGLEDIDMDESELTSHIASLGHSPERNNVPASARSGASDWDTTVADETPRGDSKALGDTVKKANIADESRAKPANKATHDSDSQWDSDDDNEIPVLPSEAGKSKQQDPSGGACGSAGKRDAVKSLSGSVSTEFDTEEGAEGKPSTSSLFSSENSFNCDQKEKRLHDETLVNHDQTMRLFDGENSVNCDQKQLDAQNPMNCDQIVKLLDGEDARLNCGQIEKQIDAQNSMNCDQIVKLFDGEDLTNCDQIEKQRDDQDSVNSDQVVHLLDALNTMNCDQKEELEKFLRVDDSCDNKMGSTADELYDYDDNDDDWDSDNDSAKKDAEEEEKKELGITEDKFYKGETKEKKDMAENRMEKKKEQEKPKDEKTKDGQKGMMEEEKKKVVENEKKEENNEEERKKKAVVEKMEQSEIEMKAFYANSEKVKPKGGQDLRNLESSLPPTGNGAITNVINKKCICKSSETSLAESKLPRTSLPETNIPETRLLETKLPVTSLPETSVQETSVPETSLPETSVPETSLRETSLPETSLPETRVPVTSLRETSLLETRVREISVPETRLPENRLLETGHPETSLSETSVPETRLPETKLPEIGHLETSVPETRLPEIGHPETSLPETGLPETRLPKARLPEMSSPGSCLIEDSFVIESECLIDPKKAKEHQFHRSIKNGLHGNEGFYKVGCSKENTDVKHSSEDHSLERLAKEHAELWKEICAEIQSSPVLLQLQGSSSNRGHFASLTLMSDAERQQCISNAIPGSFNQNLSLVSFQSSDQIAIKTSERELKSGLDTTPRTMTQQTVVEKRVSSKEDIMDRKISQVSQKSEDQQKTKVQDEDKKNGIADTQLSPMYGSCLSSLEEVCEELSDDESSLDELLENCKKYDGEKTEGDTLDDLVSYQEVHALKENVTKEANVTEDEDESTWEKERKLAKKGTEKRKTEETRDALTTENAQSSGEIVPDHTSSQPKVNAVNREKEVILSSPPLEPNRDKALNLSSASASSFQQKQAPATSSGSRIPLASTVTPLGIRMSQEESTSDTDDPFSPIGSARSTARSVSLNTDMNNVIRLQEMIRDGQRKLESERSAKTLLDTKRKALENERAKLVEQLHVITREKFNLDQLKIDLESKVRHLEYQMSEETEKRKNTDVLYEKTKEQLTRKEEQCLQLTEAKQKTETSLKNEQKEKASALAVIKQLEDENESLKRQLNERNIFVVQDEGPAGHQQRKSLIKSSAVIGSEGYPQLIPTVGAASADLYAAQLEMNRERERTKDTVEELMHDNEELRKLNKELTEKWTRGEDALTHASLYYNLDVVQLKADNDRLSAQLERDSAGKETLEREVNSLKLQLSSLTSELQAARDAKTEIERQRRNHADDFNRTSEHQHQELTSTKSLVQSQSQQLSEVLPKLQKLESDLVVANTLLSERTNQLTILQKDLEKRSSVQDTLEENYRKQKEENIRLEARVGSLQERLSDVQEELHVAKQLSESKRMNGEQPDDLATLLSSLKAEHDRTKCNLEDRNASLMESMSRIKEELKSVERGRLSIEDEKRRLQAVLSETQKQQLASEASLQIANQTRQQLEAERSQLKIEIDRLKDKMEDDRQRILRLDQKIMELTQQLKIAESSATNSHEQLNKENHSLQGLLKVKHDLEENLHRMEVENAKLDAALTHERQKVTLLQKDYSESKQNQMCLEEEIHNFKNRSQRLEEKLNEAAGLKTQATQEADDNRALWESEIKSRSKLGLRLAQLEREKRELDSKVQEEKRRVRRALELKKSSEEKLEEEQGRSSQLQKEVSVLKAHLKATKKRLKELQAQGETVVRCQRCRRNRVDSDILDNGSEAENIYQNGHSPVQLDFAKHQLHYEPAAKDHRHRGSGVSDFDKLRNMENLRMNGSMYHLDQMPHQVVGSNYLATSEIDRIREKLKSEAQMELNLKLQEVNRYLDDQAVARERLDRIRDINEAEMRNEFEKVRKEMLEEISKVKHNFEGNVPVQKGPRSNETQQQMKELNEREVKLRERLLDRLDNAYSKVTNSNVDRRHPSIRNIEGDASLDGELTKSSVQHGCNDTVMNNLRHQLDQSIARHMAAAADDHNGVTANPLLLDPVGSGRYTSNGDATPSVLHQNFLL